MIKLNLSRPCVMRGEAAQLFYPKRADLRLFISTRLISGPIRAPRVQQVALRAPPAGCAIERVQ